MKNLKKLVYQYNFLKLELGDIKEEHSKLSADFESLFSGVVPQPEIDEDALREEAIRKDSEEKPKKVSNISDSTKKVYKDVAKKLHPDAGGTETSFKELNTLYKNNDLLGVVSLAVENGVEFELSEEDEISLRDSIVNIKKRIKHYETTLAYVWKYGSVHDRRNVIKTLSRHIGRDIDVDTLSDEIKDMLK